MLKSIKLAILILAFILSIIGLQTVVNASNENIQILQNNTEYLIYIKGNTDKTFKFGFSNDKSTEPELNKISETDSESGEIIAYVDNTTISMFDNTTYMWAKLDDGDYLLKGVEVDLAKSAKSEDLQNATKITKIIEADATKTSTTEKEEDGKKITTTVGEIVLKEDGNYSYIAIKLPNSVEYNNLMKLATKISKLNQETDMYVQIQTYSEFLNLFNSLKPNSEAGWIDVEKNIIYQPEDAEDGDEYVIWIKDNKTEDIDVQFLTSTKKYSEEKVKEIITTKLPVTYDNNVLLIVFAILVVLIVLVAIRIKYLSKKEN